MSPEIALNTGQTTSILSPLIHKEIKKRTKKARHCISLPLLSSEHKSQTQMEAAVATPSLLFSSPTPRRPSSCLSLPPPCSSSYASNGAKLQQPRLQFVSQLTSRNSNGSGRRSISILSLRCSSSGTDSASSSATSERWVLEPAGDGDWRHIGYRVARPGGFQIASEAAVTVGRVPEQADIVLSVATVSGTHARLEKKEGSLLVTDLESTNGTYINERRLTPGFPTPIDPGDIHLAMFRVSKMVVDVPGDASGAEQDAAETAQVSAAAQQTN
uniref:FHA domain-containing protein n=1 Tax=Oryza nivara TaxID=4536 RepID=A0A0E0J668_ORYNI